MTAVKQFDVLVVGSGLSGLSSAIHCAEKGLSVALVSSFGSERSQSVMAAGGINAAIDTKGEHDSPALHAEDTVRAGYGLEDEGDVRAFCNAAPGIIRWLESLGVVFDRDENDMVDLRAFGGQKNRRTAYSGAATGKILVTALVQKCREYECIGLVTRLTNMDFYQGLIRDGRSYGAVFFNEGTRDLEEIRAGFTIIATGGMNSLFGKTTGSTLCDGYTAGKLFSQGAELRNPEFIQYHPTCIETSMKKMLVTEAARGEGGRLFYEQDGKRVYFMEEKYGPRGNLMSRDIVSKCVYDAPSQVYLDLSFLPESVIHGKLQEVYDLCMKYLGLDVTKSPIPVSPSVHFFMGGLRVDKHHETNIRNLFAVGECASKYHGANRLGGNSLLAALYSGGMAADLIGERSITDPGTAPDTAPDFSDEIETERAHIKEAYQSRSRYPAKFIYREIAAIMNEDLGITRTEEGLKRGLESIEFYDNAVDKIIFDPDTTLYLCFSLKTELLLARAVLTAARARRETRGAHIREDYPETSEMFNESTVLSYKNGEITVRYMA